MKTLNLIILLAVVASIATRVFAQKSNESNPQSRVQRDSIVMPDPKKDQFAILTSGAVFVNPKPFPSEAITEGIVRVENTYIGDSEIDFYMISVSRGIADIGFACYESDSLGHTDVIAVTLPKSFLQEIKLMDLDEKFSRVKNYSEWIECHDSLLFGEDLGRVKKLREGVPYPYVECAEETIKLKKEIWLIDRRYMTADSITLYKVW